MPYYKVVMVLSNLHFYVSLRNVSFVLKHNSYDIIWKADLDLNMPVVLLQKNANEGI